MQSGISIRPDGSQDNEIQIQGFSITKYPLTTWESSDEPFTDAEDTLPVESDSLEMVFCYENSAMPLYDSYDKATVKDLKMLCNSEGLSVLGIKPVLISRLRNHNAKIHNASSNISSNI